MEDIFPVIQPLPMGLPVGPAPLRAVPDGVLTVDEHMRIVAVNKAAMRMFGREASQLLGQDLGQLIPPRLRGVHAAMVARFMGSDEDVRHAGQRAPLVGLRANGDEFALDATISRGEMLIGEKQARCCTALLRDLSAKGEGDTVAELLSQRICSLANRAPVAIWIVEGERVAYANDACASLFGFSDAKALIGRPMYPLLSTDTQLRMRHEIGLLGSPGELEAHTLIGHIARLDGSLHEVEVGLSAWPDHQRSFVQMVFTDISKRSQERRELLYSRRVLRELSASLVEAREEERGRIARELHDELGQRLTALKLELVAINKEQTRDRRAERSQAMIDMVDETMSAARRIAMDLRPLMLDDLGLNAAIEWQVREFERRSGLQAELRLDPDDELIPPKVATALYRIVQEALTNVARHARATRVLVSLQIKGSSVQLTVQDNGRGFPRDTSLQPRGSFGLIGMRERALMLGGRLNLHNLSSGGARLVVHLSLLDTVFQDSAQHADTAAARELNERTTVRPRPGS